MFTLITYTFAEGDITEARAAARPKHVEHLTSAGAKLAGPGMNADGEACGSVIILPEMDMAAARAFVENDPYVRAGIVEKHTITPFVGALGHWKEEAE